MQGGTLGEHLVLAGYIEDDELTAFYRQRLMVPRVDPRQLENIPTRVIARIPKDMAAEFRLVPVAVDREQNLILAMSDPSNTHAVDEITFFTGTYVVRAVANQREIATALHKYYNITTPLLAGDAPSVPVDPGSVRRRVLPPMTSPPDANQRAVRISEIVPAIREARDAEEQARRAGRFVKGKPADVAGPSARTYVPASEPAAHERRTLQEIPAEPDASAALDPEGDTRPIARVIEAELPEPEDDRPDFTAGEIVTDRADDHHSERLAAVIVDAEPEPAPEQPILLDRRSKKISVPQPIEDEDSEVVLLASPKKRPRRKSSGRRRPAETRLGIGHVGSSVDALPGIKKMTAAPAAPADAASARTVQMPAAELRGKPPSQDETRQAPTARIPKVSVEVPEEESEVAVARVPTESDRTGKFERKDSPLLSRIDDGWGEPGSTIPPPFLGAIDEEPSSPIGIPVPDVELPEIAEAKQQAYDASVRRLSTAMKQLESVTTRDQVIEQLVSFLAGSCRRTAFFAVSRGELRGWTAAGEGVSTHDLDRASLTLDQPSTFQDIVATRLPFHGPVHDAESRDFLLAAIGATPTDMTALPITVRDKVAGILFGDDRTQPIYDEHLTTLARAAGAALERIIATRKTLV